MTALLGRINVVDYDEWKPVFDQDPVQARKAATRHSVYRSIEDPNQVFVHVEFDSADEARAAQQRLLDSGLLDRFPDRDGPTVVEIVESVEH
jgi:hypothetical protein